jgi:pimeloyl-ACP methyl ester carboxylesterase
MRIARWVLGFILLAVVGTGLWVGWRVLGFGNLSRAELEARYALPSSHFVDVDGTRVHYIDEGTGPTVLILPASFMNSRTWDAVAAKLKPDYRVIRMDVLPVGLTGPEPHNNYTIERNVELVRGLMEKLDLHDLRIIATSSGAIYAYHYAASYPADVKRLVLINAAGMPRTSATDPNRARGNPIERWLLSWYKPRSYWVATEREQFAGTGSEPPAWFIDLLYDLNRREGARAEGIEQLKQFHIGDPEAILAQVKAPTLILWGLGNITVSHLEGNVFELWLTGAPSLLKKYPRAGHYPYIEIEPEVSQDIRDFFAGKLDGELRQTARLPVTLSSSPPQPTP